MIAFLQFIFMAFSFSALFHFVDITDPTTMRGHRPKIAAVLVFEVFVMLWAGLLLWGER